MNKILEKAMIESGIAVEKRINEYFGNIKADALYPYINKLSDSMEYSLFAGGKRLRPFLVLEFCTSCGKDPKDALSYACALEMIHTASLIHDDMPCMDDDDLRRGKPSNHVAFGEATALLAGDALLTSAFEIISDNELSDKQNICALKVLSKKSGILGMAGGQQIDLENEEKHMDEQTLKLLHENKTGALICASGFLGCIAANCLEESSEYSAAKVYLEALGLAFQITDDVLDVIGDEKKLGKKCGSDMQQGKTTYATLYGVDKAIEIARNEINKAKDAISCSSLVNIDNLLYLADYIIERDH